VGEKDPKKVQLGERIRELRDEKGMSREQLATAARVSVRAIVQWELGEREPGWFNMLALGDALGVTCEAFLAPPGPHEKPRPGRPPKQKPAESDTAASPLAAKERKGRRG
jgi:transcriptional regulator with XRE-family HTH domain